MSNTYLTTAFEIRGEPSDIDRFVALTGYVDALFDDARKSEPAVPGILSDLFVGAQDADGSVGTVSRVLEHEVVGPVCATIRRAAPGILGVSGDHSPDVDLLAACIRATCPSALPMGFTFAVTSDRPDVDACGGGYVVVSKYGVDGMNAATRMEAELAALRRETPLSEVQRVAFEAYDEHGDLRMMAEDAGTHRLDTMIKSGELGDSLVLFILNECSDAEGDFDEAARMMERASDQLSTVAEALLAKGETQ